MPHTDCKSTLRTATGKPSGGTGIFVRAHGGLGHLPDGPRLAEAGRAVAAAVELPGLELPGNGARAAGGVPAQSGSIFGASLFAAFDEEGESGFASRLRESEKEEL